MKKSVDRIKSMQEVSKIELPGDGFYRTQDFLRSRRSLLDMMELEDFGEFEDRPFQDEILEDGGFQDPRIGSWNQYKKGLTGRYGRKQSES